MNQNEPKSIWKQLKQTDLFQIEQKNENVYWNNWNKQICFKMNRNKRLIFLFFHKTSPERKCIAKPLFIKYRDLCLVPWMGNCRAQFKPKLYVSVTFYSEAIFTIFTVKVINLVKMKCFRWGRHKFYQTLCAAFPGQVRKLWAWLIKLFIFGWFWLVLFCFSSIETPKLAVLVKKRNNRNKHLVSDSAETSFGSSFVFFEAKLVSLDTLPRAGCTQPSARCTHFRIFCLT